MLERFKDEYLLSLRDTTGQPLRLLIHRDNLLQLVNRFSRLEIERLAERLDSVKPEKRPYKRVTAA